MTGKTGGKWERITVSCWALKTGFNSVCNRKPLEGFKQENDII